MFGLGCFDLVGVVCHLIRFTDDVINLIRK